MKIPSDYERFYERLADFDVHFRPFSGLREYVQLPSEGFYAGLYESRPSPESDAQPEQEEGEGRQHQHQGRQDAAPEVPPFLSRQLLYLRFLLLRLVEHLHLRQSALVVARGKVLHRCAYLINISFGLGLVTQFHIDLRQHLVAADVAQGGLLVVLMD